MGCINIQYAFGIKFCTDISEYVLQEIEINLRSIFSFRVHYCIMTIAVTGISGALGSAILRALKKRLEVERIIGVARAPWAGERLGGRGAPRGLR